MSSAELTRTVNLVVAATISGNQVQIIDRYGRVLTDVIDRKLLGRLVKDDNTTESEWRKSLQKQLGRIRSRTKLVSSLRREWLMKCSSLSASFRMRSIVIQRPTTRQRHENYRTITWESAGRRLWHQGNNRQRHVARSGWHRWSVTVANNHNKRTGG
jgi:hypothetical protein